MRRWLAAAALAALAVAAVAAQPNPFRRVDNWFTPPADVKFGALAGVVPARDGDLWVVHRGEPPILKVTRAGAVVRSFGQGLFHTAHGAFVDRDGNLWVPDSGAFNDKGRVEGKAYQVFKFDPSGTLLMTLGKANVPMAGSDTFLAPVAVVVNEAGEIFVADGHMPRGGPQDGDRIVKLDRQGRFLAQWGRKGSAPGELNGPHAMVMDARGRLLVADRDNLRVQIFDQAGAYLGHWMHYARPSGVWVDRADTVYVAHNADPAKVLPGWAFGIRMGSAKDGTLTGLIPDLDSEVVGTDLDGNLYAGPQSRRTLEKYVRN